MEIIPTLLGLGKQILMLSMPRGSISSGISVVSVNEKYGTVAYMKGNLQYTFSNNLRFGLPIPAVSFKLDYCSSKNWAS